MIKALAVDMDGTFLNSKKDYNRPLFKKLYYEMKDCGIKFITCSLNDHFLKSAMRFHTLPKTGAASWKAKKFSLRRLFLVTTCCSLLPF